MGNSNETKNVNEKSIRRKDYKIMKHLNKLVYVIGAVLLFFSLIIAVHCASMTLKEDVPVYLNVGDEVVMQCPSPAQGKDWIQMYKYNASGIAAADAKTTVHLKDGGKWKCTPQYSESAKDVKSPVSKDMKKYAPACDKFQCKAAANAQVFCEISSAVSFKNGLYAIVAIVATTVALFAY